MHHPATLATINARLADQAAKEKEAAPRTIGQTTVPYPDPIRLGPIPGDVDDDVQEESFSRFVEGPTTLLLTVFDLPIDTELPEGLQGEFESVGELLRAVYHAGYQFSKNGFPESALYSGDHIADRMAVEVVQRSGISTVSLVR